MSTCANEQPGLSALDAAFTTIMRWNNVLHCEQLEKRTALPEEEPPGTLFGAALLTGVPKWKFCPFKLYASSSM